MGPDYAGAAFMKTILLPFSRMNFTHEKISYAFILNIKLLQGHQMEFHLVEN